MRYLLSRFAIVTILLALLTNCSTIKTMNDYAAKTHRFEENLPEVSDKRWRPIENNYFIDQLNQHNTQTQSAPLLEDQIESRKALQNIPKIAPKAKPLTLSSSVDDRIIDSYSYSIPSSSDSSIENLTSEQFVYEKERLEKSRDLQ